MKRVHIAIVLLFIMMAFTFLPLHISSLKVSIQGTPTGQEASVTVPPAVVAASEKETAIEPSVAVPDIPVLMYHILLDGRNDAISVDPERFREHMTTINEAGYTTITDYQLADHLQNNTSLPEKPILITFDDGYKSIFTEAFPVLKELGMNATVNVITSRIYEAPNSLHPDEFEKITWEDARLMKGTVLLQGHTWDSHRQQTNVYGDPKGLISGRMADTAGDETQTEFEKRVYEDLLLSKQTIEEKMGYKVVTLAYPYGDYSQDTIKLARQAGYQIAFTVKPGLVNRTAAKDFELNRFTANGALTGEQLLALIETAE